MKQKKIPDFKEIIKNVNSEFLSFNKLETLQVNLGNMCNQYCNHCHIDAGPAGKKIMSKEVMKNIVTFLKNHKGLILDMTGGCPELNPNFKFFIEEIYKFSSCLMVRTNLTILLEDKMDWIPHWYKDHKIIVIASLPCYTKEN